MRRGVPACGSTISSEEIWWITPAANPPYGNKEQPFNADICASKGVGVFLCLKARVGAMLRGFAMRAWLLQSAALQLQLVQAAADGLTQTGFYHRAKQWQFAFELNHVM